MREKKMVPLKTVQLHAARIAKDILEEHSGDIGIRLYGVPRGGTSAALAVAQAITALAEGNKVPILVDTPQHADYIIDDIIDSGATRARYQFAIRKPFYALIDLTHVPSEERFWYVFPWELSDPTAQGKNVGKDSTPQTVEDNVVRILQFIGEDPARGGLIDTPRRVAKAYSEWFSGYGKNPADILKVFEDGAEACDQMVVVKDIPIFSFCEHHMAQIFGTATIGYIPDGKIVGLSKLSRLADMFARRLQVQERLTNQIADALQEHLKPKGVGVLIRARHMCMESRGVCQQGHHTITTALRGAMLEEGSARAEFLEAAR